MFLNDLRALSLVSLCENRLEDFVLIWCASSSETVEKIDHMLDFEIITSTPKNGLAHMAPACSSRRRPRINFAPTNLRER
jgi:hypothetical protein